MADTQHLQVTAPPPPSMGNENVETTPYRRGHRHKRSFAISGDFEFVKTMEPSSVPPPLPFNVTSPTPMSPAPLEPEYAAKPTPSALQSPKFFVSEDPKFSSPFKGVPDAIINLDDALKTKPRSFKSHRRAESAPADLEAFMNLKNFGNSNGDTKEESACIREEDDDDGGNNDDTVRTRANAETQLMSPLRPRSPTPGDVRSDNLGFHSGSPSRNNTLHANGGGNFNNSLKINRQKQRYYHYTKQLPIQAASQIQSQSLKGQASSGSLSSANMQTPGSMAHTPSKQMTTPLTPVSSGNPRFQPSHVKNDDRPTSPTLRNHHHNHTQVSNRNGPSSTSFNYESKLYDMPHSITVTKSPSSTSNDNRTLNHNQDLAFSQEEKQSSQRYHGSSSSSFNLSVSSTKQSNTEEENNLIPESLLLGEPGDAEDPTVSLDREFARGLHPVSAENRLPSGSDSTSAKSHQESGTVSGSVCITEREQSKDKKKKKSRLSSFMSLFARSPYHH
ncbi:ZYRO0F18260p [Zygosaccharomyces rouxii]|uniref:ZYRO0F18260p n=2 Tax=Zygosaccharomyces rouxii TaxID=4956 RepID=C5DZ52_ZYGRC|nr:uncharacterized protein ZYRO0F18260g [Zygosaccharomyces rouxii]KAH9201226.1 Laminarase-resistance protein LRE1 and protein HLR1 [Zygosaccharomyces rouxii]CAQ43311.1 Laminarase-resistance protein LRE1 and Protein HLR1 [Zygosaccharomyces rouxii]CAR29063.1 ZYRO0F18260p [Zygosaccharomyces rouxii]